MQNNKGLYLIAGMGYNLHLFYLTIKLHCHTVFAQTVESQLPQNSLFLLQLLFDRLQLLQQSHVCAVHPCVHHINRHGQTEPAKKKEKKHSYHSRQYSNCKAVTPFPSSEESGLVFVNAWLHRFLSREGCKQSCVAPKKAFAESWHSYLWIGYDFWTLA